MNKPIKKIIAREILIVLVLVFATTGCDLHDRGYEDGYEGAEKSFLCSISGSYKEGYSNGAEDAYYYNSGYNDAKNGREPRYPGWEEYMEGYREGRR